jgi:hypothetical protein
LHLVVPGTAGPGIFGKLLGSEQAVLADPSREEALKGCNIPLTVVNVGKLVDGPGGGAEISLVQVIYHAFLTILGQMEEQSSCGSVGW